MPILKAVEKSDSTWYRWTWTDLHALGSSKVVNSAYIWLVLIPFLSRVALAISSELSKEIKLPPNFLAFYYAAFFFTIAAALFNWKCPMVAKVAPTFGDFQAKGYSALELKNWYHVLVPSPVDPKHRDGKLILQFLNLFPSTNSNTEEEMADSLARIAGTQMMADYWRKSVGERDLPKVHDLAINTANPLHPIARSITTVCYGLGFILFGLVVLYNLYAVILETVVQFK